VGNCGFNACGAWSADMRLGRGAVSGGSASACARCGDKRRGPASLRGGSYVVTRGGTHYRNASREAFAAVWYAEGKVTDE